MANMHILSQLSFPLLCISLYLLYIIIKHEFRRAPRIRRHGPPSHPVLGSLISFYKNRHRLLDWYTDLLSHSPTQTIVVSRFGATTTVVTANPQNVEYILKTNFSNFPKGRPFTQILGDFLGNGIFNVDGDVWQTQRTLANHVFNAKSFREYFMKVLKEEINNKLLPIMESLAQEQEVDLQDLLRRLGFDVICKATLGVDPCALNCYAGHPDVSLMEAFDRASEISAKRGAAQLSVTWKAKRLLGIGSEKILKDSIQKIHAFVTNAVRDKTDPIVSRRPLFDDEEDLLSRIIAGSIIGSYNNVNGDKKYDELIRDMMISLIMAGRDTTSAAMTWLFYLLSANPDIEQELMKELRIFAAAAANNQEEEEEINIDWFSSVLKELRLLKACICESMRLYPPVAWDSKHAISDDLLPDGTPVRAGDRVTYFPYGMGRMESLWGKDRLQFRPERWVLERNTIGEGARSVGALKNVCPYKFPVFQAGPRVCLGKELAFMQMKYVVASILGHFEIRPATTNPPVFVPFLTAHMAGGFKVFVRRRRRGQHV
ncbi:hypothetical protein ACH5RR_010948 [Cinchona calisaya]|uniref:Cytochrome P450 n=1 Tax=Cinchona calisaya TaxID=153742 RepID=A0ABD3A744_9GENT